MKAIKKRGWRPARPAKAEGYEAMSDASWLARPKPGADGELSWERVEKAAKLGDLFHPGGWKEWAGASDALFERACALLTPAELERLATAKGFYGSNWTVAFSESPAKLRSLMGRGLDPSVKSCVIDGVKVEGAFYAAWNGRMRALEGMMEAGFEPPGREWEMEDGLGEEAIPVETALQALSLSLMADSTVEPRERSMRVMGWLGSDGLGPREKNAKGDDALKMALGARSAPALAEMLLELGADPYDENEAGESAFDAFERGMAAARREGSEAKWVAVGERLGALREREALDRASGAAERGPGPRRV